MAHRRVFHKGQKGGGRNKPRATGTHHIASSHLVIGRNAVAELLKHRPDSVKRIMSAFGERDARHLSLLEQAESLGLEVSELSDQALSSEVQSTSHQGIAAELKTRTLYDLKWLIAKSEQEQDALVLLLDSINDPHNFGAILRVAECFGASAVVISPNRGSGITPTVTKTSAGASELVPIVQVANLAEASRKLLKAGFSPVATDLDPEAVDLREFAFPAKTLLMLLVVTVLPASTFTVVPAKLMSGELTFTFPMKRSAPPPSA